MTDSDLAALLAECMMIMLQIGGPLLGAALGVGVLVSLIQAVTQINEATLLFVPKLVALGVAFALLSPFMLMVLTEYFHRLVDRMIGGGP